MFSASKRLIALVLLAVASVAAAGGKIRHVVVLMEENRSFDHMLGLFKGTSRGTRGKKYSNDVTYKAKNGSDVTQRVYWDSDAPYVNYCDPDHSYTATMFKIFGTEKDVTDKTPETMSGFAQFEYNLHKNLHLDECNVMQGFTPERLPVMTTLAEEFVLFDNFFCSVPGPTWPNRMFFMAGSSDGLTETGPWYKDQVGQLFPGKTIFDQVGDAGGSWKLYYDDTPWELFMESLAHQPEHLLQMSTFFDDAAKGTLPDFSFINPRAGVNLTLNVGSNDMHPDHDVALGEALYRDVYQALRNGPAWNETLFVLTFDEHGGFWDHVDPPRPVPSPGNFNESYPDKGFDFTRGGIRIPTILISPWLPKGHVVTDPPAAQKPFPTSVYELTSIMASTRKLLDFMNTTGPLTKRDAWAATFENLFDLLDEPRTDCPKELPAPPKPAGRKALEEEADMPINPLQNYIMAVHANLAGVEYPHHIRRQGDVEAWAREHFQQHRERTLHWKRRKSAGRPGNKHVRGRPAQAEGADANAFSVVVIPCLDRDNVGRAWSINLNKTTTLATLSLKLEKEDGKWCLDGGDMSEGNYVSVSPCYPSSVPHLNRDPSQQWHRPSDASVRPANDTSLCVTNTVQSEEGGIHAFLAKCDGSVQQHYSWQNGAAVQPGASPGVMYYGDDIYNLAVVSASQRARLAASDADMAAADAAEMHAKKKGSAHRN